MNVKYEEVLEFLNQLKSLTNNTSIINKNSKNMFQIMGYPHYENVVSNILAFLLDPNEEHGFKGLWLRSLMECYFEKKPITTDMFFDGECDIEREASTAEKKRIDLLIKGDSYIIGIENKIYADVDNPFESYDKMINDVINKEYGGNQGVKYEILLSVKNEGDKFEFINITYKDYIQRVESNWDKYKDKANDKWRMIAEDFIANLKSFLEGEMINWDNEWESIISKSDNQNNINKIFANIRKSISNRYELLKQIKESLNGTGLDKEHDIYGVGKTTASLSGWSGVYFDVEYNNNITIVLETYIEKEIKKMNTIILSLWCRVPDNKAEKATIVEEIRSRIDVKQEWEQTDHNSWGRTFNIKKYNVLEVNPKDIAAKIIEVAKKIKNRE